MAPSTSARSPFPCVLCRLAGEPGSGDVDLAHALFQVVGGQPDAVRAECVCLDEIRARPQILFVNGTGPYRHA